MESLPDTLPLTDEKHALAVFLGNPAHHIHADLNDWEDTLNLMMHRTFGYGTTTDNKQV